MVEGKPVTVDLQAEKVKSEFFTAYAGKRRESGEP
jgi:hypothetical protein